MEDKGGMENGYALCLNKWALDKSIKNDLGLLLIISSLCAEKGYCWASNEYLGNLFDVTPESISRKLKLLENKNYITIEYERRGTQVIKRYLRLTKISTDHYQKCQWTINKNVKENNTSINNISLIIKEYENEIGFMTPFQLEKIQSYLDSLDEEMIIEAIHIASKNNKKSLSYIEAILKQWIAQGIKCVSDIPKKKTNKKEYELDQSYLEKINDLYDN